MVHTALSSVFKGEKEVRDAVLFVRDTMFLRASVFYIIRSWPPTFQLLLMCDNRRTRIRQRAVTSWIWMRWTNHGEGARSLVSKDAHIVRACENAECLVSWRQFLADISCRHAYRAWDQCSSGSCRAMRAVLCREDWSIPKYTTFMSDRKSEFYD